MRAVVGTILVTVAASMSLGACGPSPAASSTPTGTSPAGAAATPAAGATAHAALDRWHTAYSFLSTRTRPTEIVCIFLTASGATPSPAPRPARFYGFSDAAAWKPHLITRKGPFPKGTFEDCLATVPTTVPYGPAIETFLNPYGLTFAASRTSAARLTPIEIAYAGQNADDPDLIYRDEPGLFGLRMALAQIGDSAFKPGTSQIVPPTDETTAARYLHYAKPLLDWYRQRA